MRSTRLWFFGFLLSSVAFADGVCPSAQSIHSKWDFWNNGTCLRGANIWQKVVKPDYDGNDFGSDYVGPPFTLNDFKSLAALGANYVNLSVPGIFTETAPYVVDDKVVAHLDKILDLLQAADLFAVISFRTGPGRNEAGFDSGSQEQTLNTVWTDKAAQDGWVNMWAYAAKHFMARNLVLGYDLMVEPNANDVWLNIWDPKDFYPKYANTLYDWNQLSKRITTGIRNVDSLTPILIGGMNYSEVGWLNSLQLTNDKRTVYAIHQYAPVNYTHQDAPLKLSYPGAFDPDGSGEKVTIDRNWLSDLLSPVSAFKDQYSVPTVVNEWGVMRWEKGAETFADDSLNLFESMGMNHAVWLWEPSWNLDYDQFNFRYGPKKSNHRNDLTNALLEKLKAYWSRNQLRPSNFPQPFRD